MIFQTDKTQGLVVKLYLLVNLVYIGFFFLYMCAFQVCTNMRIIIIIWEDDEFLECNISII